MPTSEDDQSTPREIPAVQPPGEDGVIVKVHPSSWARQVREQNVGFRGDLNACIVLINLLWHHMTVGSPQRRNELLPLLERRIARIARRYDRWPEVTRAYESDTRTEQAFDHVLRRVERAGVTATEAQDREEITAPRVNPTAAYAAGEPLTPQVRAVADTFRPNVAMLVVGTDELRMVTQMATDRDLSLRSEVSGWSSVLDRLAQESPQAAYQAACVYARRHVMLRGALDRLVDAPHEPARPDRAMITALSLEAIDQSRRWLTSAWTDVPELRKWAPQDPVFRTLKDQALSDVFHEHHDDDVT